jgi:hypothetical protein
MRRTHGALLIVLASASSACPCCKERTEDQVGVSYNRILRNPSNACQWIAAHSSAYDGDFRDCAAKKLGALTAFINKQIDECDQIFSDQDFRNGCYRDRNVPSLEFRESVLASVIEITVHGNGCALVACNCAAFAATYQPIADAFDQNSRDLGLTITWAALLDGAQEADKSDLGCDFCSDPWR